MDLASIIGLVACFCLVIYAIVTGDDGVAAIKYFLDPASAIITFGGAFCCVMASYSMSDFLNGLKSIKLIFKVPTVNNYPTWHVKKVCFPWKKLPRI